MTSKELYGDLKGIITNEENENAYEQKYREIFPSYKYDGNDIKPSHRFYLHVDMNLLLILKNL